MNGYIGLYHGKQYEIYADNVYDAKIKLSEQLKVKKTWDISIYLAEPEGKPIVHDPAILD